MNPTPYLPLAGLCSYEEAASVGLAVDVTVARLRRYVYLKSQLLFVMAEHFNNVPEWEVKGALSLHLWQDAEHSAWFRNRITEMRTPPHHLDAVPDPALQVLVETLASASGTEELLMGIYDVLKPAMADAYRAHLRAAHKIADHPTRRLLRFALEEEEEQIIWGGRALEKLRIQAQSGERENREAWAATLRRLLEEAGGVSGEGMRPSRATAACPAKTRQPQIPRRDARFSHVWESRGVVPAAESPVHERIWWMMNVRLNEMHVSELIASVLADWKGQPWEFYHDLARHLWDETRHCMLGEVAFASQGIDFTQIPTHIGFAKYPNTQLPPQDRYAFLWGIEQGLMGKSGKQAEVALAKAGGDERATVFQDFDWADEVLHAQIGRRWLGLFYGDREQMGSTYERVRPAYDRMKDEDLQKPGRDWWPAFYATHLKHKDPSLGRVVAGAEVSTY